MKFVLLALLLSVRANAGVLEDVAERVVSSVRPVVVFDLDDTLFETRPRTLAVLNAFVSQTEIGYVYRREFEIVRGAKASQIRYHFGDTMKSLGIQHPEFVRLAEDFWKSRFFSNDYCGRDVSVQGAPAYVNRLWLAGAHIVYLTGRDEPRMGVGTREALFLQGFPSQGSTLIMKPAKEEDDLDFKKRAFGEIAKLGEVVAAFENEPRNANALKEAFPEASVALMDTIHSGSGPLRPDVIKGSADYSSETTLPSSLHANPIPGPRVMQK